MILLSVILEARSTLHILLLKADIVGNSLMCFGTVAHNYVTSFKVECSLDSTCVSGIFGVVVVDCGLVSGNV